MIMGASAQTPPNPTLIVFFLFSYFLFNRDASQLPGRKFIRAAQGGKGNW